MDIRDGRVYRLKQGHNHWIEVVLLRALIFQLSPDLVHIQQQGFFADALHMNVCGTMNLEIISQKVNDGNFQNLGNLLDVVYSELGNVVLDLAVSILRDTHFLCHVVLRIVP